jgi:superoxide dismutase, Fe-Mn family
MGMTHSFTKGQFQMAIQLPPLPYEFQALEPQISEDTLKFHYEKHHAGYVKKLNELIKNSPYDKLLLEEIVFESAQNPSDKKIYNNAAQTWNHSFYWNCMTPKSALEPSKEFQKLLEKQFGSVSQFQEQFTQACLDLFGSGWVWLVKDSDEGLSILPMENAENPILLGKTPLLVCYVWEHAYYLDYQNQRNEYLKCFVKMINWDFVESNYQKSPTIYHTVKPQATTGLFH